MFGISRQGAVVMGLIVVLLVAVVGSFWHVFLRDRPAAEEETFAQEYSLAFADYDGAEVLLSSFRREVLVAYTWASWCTYCAAELENLASLKRSYGDDVQIVAINRAESALVARDYTQKLAVDGLVLLIDTTDSFFKEIGGYAMPETVFIDSRGTVIFHQRGPMRIEEVRRKIEELLGR